MRRWRRAALAATALAVVVLLAAQLLKPGERLASSNTRVTVSSRATVIVPGGVACGDAYVPASAATLRLFAGTPGPPGPPIDVTIREGRRLLTRGRHPGGYPDDRPIEVRLATPHPGTAAGRVCLRNRGRTNVEFANAQEFTTGLSVIDPEELIRFDFLMAGSPRPIEVAPAAARRAARMKSSLVGPWAIWLLPVALVLVGWLVVAAIRPEDGR